MLSGCLGNGYFHNPQADRVRQNQHLWLGKPLQDHRIYFDHGVMVLGKKPGIDVARNATSGNPNRDHGKIGCHQFAKKVADAGSTAMIFSRATDDISVRIIFWQQQFWNHCNRFLAVRGNS